MTKVIKTREEDDETKPDVKDRYEILYEHYKYLQKKHENDKQSRIGGVYNLMLIMLRVFRNYKIAHLNLKQFKVENQLKKKEQENPLKN